MAAEDRLKHSDYPRGGHKLDIGRLWEINVGNSLRELSVFASRIGIRVVDSYCDEWEVAERDAVHLTAKEARALGEALMAAADVEEQWSRIWGRNAVAADPGPALDVALRESIARFDKGRGAAPVDHSQLCPDCIADADAIDEALKGP